MSVNALSLDEGFLNQMDTDVEPANTEKVLRSFVRKNHKLRHVNERLKRYKAHMDRDHLERELRIRTKHLRRHWRQNQRLNQRIRDLETDDQPTLDVELTQKEETN